MLLPVFEDIRSDACASFKKFLLADVECEAVPDVLTAEEQIASFVKKLSADLNQLVPDVRSQQALANRERCTCGRLRAVHRTTVWYRATLDGGDVRMVDPYTYCHHCHSAERPAHAWTGTSRERWSFTVQRQVMDFVADESCGASVKKLKDHHPGCPTMGRTTALAMLHHHGEQARMFIDMKIEAAIADYKQEGNTRFVVPELEVEYDAGMVPVATYEVIEYGSDEKPQFTAKRGYPKKRKKARWEEVKAGLVQVPGEASRLYCLRPTNELDAVFHDLFGLACIKGWDLTTNTRGIADGARYIRMRLTDAFEVGHFLFILDRPHLKEHLGNAGAGMVTYFHSLVGREEPCVFEDEPIQLKPSISTEALNTSDGDEPHTKELPDETSAELSVRVTDASTTLRQDEDKISVDAKHQRRIEILLSAGPFTAQEWASSALVEVEAGRVAGVIEELELAYADDLAFRKQSSDYDSKAEEEHPLRVEAGYLKHNSGSVDYQTYRDNGWSTASGEIESSHRSIVQRRLKIPGAWWRPSTIDHILALRVLKANEGWWDEYWEDQRLRWGHRARDLAEGRPRVTY